MWPIVMKYTGFVPCVSKNSRYSLSEYRYGGKNMGTVVLPSSIFSPTPYWW